MNAKISRKPPLRHPQDSIKTMTSLCLCSKFLSVEYQINYQIP